MDPGRDPQARPEAQRLIAEIDGLVGVRTDLPRGEAIGLAQMTLDDAVVSFDERSLNSDRRSTATSSSCTSSATWSTSSSSTTSSSSSSTRRSRASAPAATRELLPTGACTAVEERFADTFAKWALRGRISLAGSGYGIPAPASIEDWGAPLGLLAAQLNAR